MQDTYYEVLGVGREADAEELKNAHRRLMRTVHPDRGGSASIFRQVNDAYDVLKDPATRADYDASLSGPPPPFSTPGPTTGASAPPGERPRSEAGGGWTGQGERDVELVPAPYASSVARTTNLVAGGGLVWTAGWVLVETSMGLFWSVLALPVVLGLVAARRPGRHWSTTALAVCTAAALALAAMAPIALVAVAPVVLAGWVVRTLGTRHRRALAAEDSYPTGPDMMRQSYTLGRPNGTWWAQQVPPEHPASHAVAEFTTASALNRLLEIPGAKVFHGLVYPGGERRDDVDHAVLVGTTVVVAQSRWWGAGEYSFDSFGAVTRDGSPFAGGDVRFAEAVAAYSQRLGGAEVHGVVVVQSGDGPVRVGANPSCERVRLVAGEDLVSTLGPMLAERAGVVDRRLVSLLSVSTDRARAVPPVRD